MPNQPTDFNTCFAQLCEAFELTTQGVMEVQRNARLEIVSKSRPFANDDGVISRGVAHVYRKGVMNGNPYRMPAEANAKFFALAHNLMPSLIDRFERLKESLIAQSEAVHFHECTVGTFYDCPNPVCKKTREVLSL